MLYKIITTTNAREDIQAAIKWENNKLIGLGVRFLNELENKFTKLSITPGMGSIRYENVRVTSTSIFKYNIHYIINKDKNEVIILRVLHSFRKPIY